MNDEKVGNHLKEIRDVEGLRIIRVVNKRNNNIIPSDLHKFRKYPMNKKLPDEKTVSDYVRQFEQVYPGYTCDVGSDSGRAWA